MTTFKMHKSAVDEFFLAKKCGWRPERLKSTVIDDCLVLLWLVDTDKLFYKLLKRIVTLTPTRLREKLVKLQCQDSDSTALRHPHIMINTIQSSFQNSHVNTHSRHTLISA